MKRPLYLALVIMLSCLVSVANMANAASEPFETITWDVLMPANYTLDGLFTDQQVEQFNTLDDLDPRAVELMDKLQAALQSAPIVPEMDGKAVRIPGFVVPLEGEDQNIFSFFLVPYFGACIHVPPPPSNQIIYVHYEPGVRLESLYDAVWISGVLRTDTFSHELASAGYRVEAQRIEPYEEE